ARWFIVGSATFLIDTTLFLLAFSLTDIVVVSNLFSGAIATLFNYLSHYHWSFASDREHKQSTVIYLAFFFIFLFLGTTLVSTFVHSGLEPDFAKLCSALITAPISFFIMKFVTFRRRSDAN
ncbi:MAG: GtrA family protein, partial [Actinomycetota bacterium]